jgi:purine-binding chemotaxis protein CheW
VEGRISLLLLTAAGTRCAVELDCVRCVLRAAAITALPGAPRGVRGLLNLSGALLPVFDPGRYLDLPERGMEPSDRLVVARTRNREVALLVEAVEGIEECSAADLTEARDLHPRLEGIRGAAVLENGITVIYDLELFLSLSEEQELEAAFAAREDST